METTVTNNEEFKQFCINHHKQTPIKTLQLTDFYCFLIEQENWENEIAINTKEDYEAGEWEKVVFCDSDTFYDKIGIDMWDFEKVFVSFDYINEMENSANLVVNINEEVKRFVIDVV